MPLPGYQREDSAGLSSRTAKTFSLPYSRYGVRSSRNDAYPYGQPPTNLPFSQTTECDIAPSKSINICLSLSDSVTLKCLRYQLTPTNGRLPVSPGSACPKSASIPQSCGKFSCHHDASSKFGRV